MSDFNEAVVLIAKCGESHKAYAYYPRFMRQCQGQSAGAFWRL